MRIFTKQAGLIFCLLASVVPLSNAAVQPQELKGVGIVEHLGKQLSVNELTFRDENSKMVPLSEYFHPTRPVLLTLVYYQCPMLCNLVLNGVLDSIKKLDWRLGSQFEMVTVSINPKETPELAAKKKKSYLKYYDRPKSAEGWHFLTGEDTQIQKLASEVGFQYRYDPAEKQYIHAAAIYILTPSGKISRYLYGTSFKPQNLKLALLEASNGAVATSTLDRVLLFCFHFDPYKNSYTLSMWRMVQLVLVIQVVLLGGFLAYLWMRKADR